MTAVASSRASSWQIIEYQLIYSRRSWRPILVGGLITPLLYVLALGVGLGSVVNQHTDELGVPYLVFVAPAFLAAAALQIGTAEATYPIMTGFKWWRSFYGMAATPLSPRQIALGQVYWIAIRVFASASAYLAVMACFGACPRWQAILAVPAATLAATAFASTIAAIAASIDGEGAAFSAINRFIVTPMFLFSGTFYPISKLPEWAQVIAYLSPLWHSTELCRAASIGGLSPAAVVVHVLYLCAWLGVGVALTIWRFQVRLTR